MTHLRRTAQEEHLLYSAVTFRLLLDSLARPGKINHLEYPDASGEPPHYYAESIATNVPLNLYALGALLTLLDREVTFAMAANKRWLSQTDAAVQWLALRSGASLASPGAATFAFFCDSGSGLVTQLNIGTLLEPELSTTALYCVERIKPLSESLDEVEEWLWLELAGPGIADKRVVGVSGLDRAEIGHIITMRRGYPLGVDVYLIDAVGRCIGLPRTTSITLHTENP